MKRYFFNGAFGLGAMAVLWIATGFLGALHWVALAMTMLIAAVYVYGAVELRHFRRDTQTLENALTTLHEPVVSLDAWIANIHPALQSPVRLRIEGERNGFPGPAFTPYLVGLLVMLGMLGTFLGMVVTLKGAVFALEGTTDLQAIRTAFAAPIKGLGLSFGTSVAGVAASAMLGLMSAISRGERMLTAQLLDRKIATVLRSHSHAFQREEAFKALQLQSQALPLVFEQLQIMMSKMEAVTQLQSDRLLHNQESFHSHVTTRYRDLANSVEQSLCTSLSQSAQVAGESIRPAIEAAMTGISQEARVLHQRMVETTQTQMSALAASLVEQWQTAGNQALAQQQEICSTLGQTADLMRAEMRTLRDDEAMRGQAAVDRLGELQSAVALHLTTLGTALEDPIARLIHTASEAPRAAAEVIGTLRQEVSNSAARDNALLEERSRIMGTLSTLLDAINHAAAEQRVVIDALVSRSGDALDHASHQFSDKVDAQAANLSDIAAQVSTSAIDVSSLSDTFGFAVRTFGEANGTLIASLQRIENAMDKSMARSDDQLAYYVAQAREIIDLSIMSQKEIVEELRQLSGRQARMLDEVAG